MRKRFLICLLACVMVLSTAGFVMAATEDGILSQATMITSYELTSSDSYIEIIPLTEQTQIHWRTTSAGVLQFRVWGLTSGRWLTDWINA